MAAPNFCGEKGALENGQRGGSEALVNLVSPDVQSVKREKKETELTENLDSPSVFSVREETVETELSVNLVSPEVKCEKHLIYGINTVPPAHVTVVCALQVSASPFYPGDKICSLLVNANKKYNVVMFLVARPTNRQP